VNEYQYQYYGYRLASEVAFPLLPAGGGGGEADIRLRLGPVPDHLAHSVWSSPFLEIGENGEAIAKAGDRLRFRIAGGNEIVLDTDRSQSAMEMETHFTSLVAGVVLHQRRALPLHASAVSVDGLAVAFAGPSGIGKSTFASALALHGYPLIADDVCRIEFHPEGGPTVAPGPARLRLWPDMAMALGRDPETLMTGRSHHPKRVLTDVDKETNSVPLRALIRLSLDVQAKAPRLERLTGPQSVMPVDELVYRARLGRTMGRQVEIFQQLTELGAAIRVYRLTRPEGPPDRPRLADLVRQAITEG
jgi:hypothetical protein